MDILQNKRIGIIVGCLVLAAVITVITQRKPSGSGGAKGPIQLLCVNKKCNAEFELSRDDFRKQMMEKTSTRTMAPGMMGPQILTCNKCGKESAYIASKCEKCESAFIPNYTQRDYPDKCPKCGYSAIEESEKKSKFNAIRNAYTK